MPLHSGMSTPLAAIITVDPAGCSAGMWDSTTITLKKYSSCRVQPGAAHPLLLLLLSCSKSHACYPAGTAAGRCCSLCAPQAALCIGASNPSSSTCAKPHLLFCDQATAALLLLPCPSLPPCPSQALPLAAVVCCGPYELFCVMASAPTSSTCMKPIFLWLRNQPTLAFPPLP